MFESHIHIIMPFNMEGRDNCVVARPGGKQSCAITAGRNEEIETPEKIRKIQQVLHHNAKTNKTWRAWSLYANLLDEDVLAHAAAKVIANKGAAGIDGMSVSSIGTSEARSSSRGFAQSNNWLLARYS
jgi:2-succinyl-5-enolpyruvyl-6-hydroxy-3-cyclohexene-1-carboxylate synthase